MRPEHNDTHWTTKCYLLLREAWSYAISCLLAYFIVYNGYLEFLAGDHYPWSVLAFGVYIYVLRIQYTNYKLPWQ